MIALTMMASALEPSYATDAECDKAQMLRRVVAQIQSVLFDRSVLVDTEGGAKASPNLFIQSSGNPPLPQLDRHDCIITPFLILICNTYK